MRTMTQKEKNKYRELVSEASQLRFDPDFFEADIKDKGMPLYICKDGYMQYFFSRYPADEPEMKSLSDEPETAAENAGSENLVDQAEADGENIQLGFEF